MRISSIALLSLLSAAIWHCCFLSSEVGAGALFARHFASDTSKYFASFGFDAQAGTLPASIAAQSVPVHSFCFRGLAAFLPFSCCLAIMSFLTESGVGARFFGRDPTRVRPVRKSLILLLFLYVTVLFLLVFSIRQPYCSHLAVLSTCQRSDERAEMISSAPVD